MHYIIHYQYLRFHSPHYNANTINVSTWKSFFKNLAGQNAFSVWIEGQNAEKKMHFQMYLISVGLGAVYTFMRFL